MDCMSFFSEKLKSLLDNKGMTVYQLWNEADMNETLAYNVVNGKRRPTDEVLEKLSALGKLGLKRSELFAWRAIDDYGAEALNRAIDVLETNDREKNSWHYEYQYRTGFNHCLQEVIDLLKSGKSVEDLEKWRETIFEWRHDQSRGRVGFPPCR